MLQIILYTFIGILIFMEKLQSKETHFKKVHNNNSSQKTAFKTNNNN